MRSRAAALAAALLLMAGEASAQRTTFVLVHGAWGGGWDWRQVDSLLTVRGHRVQRVTLTGLGERVHLASPDISLETHIADVVNTILWERLDEVVLVGHSYGGMVITGAADRIPERIRSLVYVDALLPDAGESAMDLLPADLAAGIRAGARDGFIGAGWEPPDRPAPHDVPHPMRTLTDTLRLTGGSARLPGMYILTEQPEVQPDPFSPFAERAAARGWRVQRMRADHVPERSAPEALVNLLLQAP